MGEMIRGLRHAVRSLARSPGFTLPALTIVTIGITAATAIFTVVDSVVLDPLPFADARRLVMVCEDHVRLDGACIVSPANALDLANGSSQIAEMGFGRGWAFSLSGDGRATGLRGGLATGSFFRALGVRPAAGRLFTDDEIGADRDDVALLSHGFWTSHFGADPAVLGSAVVLDGETVTLVGILPPDFDAPLDMTGIQLWRPPHVAPGDDNARSWRGWQAMARLADGATLETATSELQATYAGLRESHEEIDDEWRVLARPLIDVVVGDTRAVFQAFMAAAGLLLLIVCANVANLLLARGLGRRTELAVRAALGAERSRLVMGILGESLVLTGTATVAAVVLAKGMTGLLVRYAPQEIPRLDEVALDGSVLLFTALVAMVTTAVFAALPALKVTGGDLAESVRTGSGRTESVGTGRLRMGLVVAELALSVILVVSAGLLTRSFAEYLTWDPGFEREGILAVSAFLSPGKYETRDDLIPVYREGEARLAAIPGVLAATSASAGPLFGGGDGAAQFRPEGWDVSRELPSASWFDVGPGYFATLGLPLIQGREFTEADGADVSTRAVVNESLANLAWPGESAVGRTLHLPEREMTLEVVGVVADVQPMTPGASAQPEMYWPNRQLGRWGTFFLVRTAGDPTAVGRAVTDALTAVDPDLSLGTPRTLVSAESRQLVRPRFQAMVLFAFALAALALAAVGVYAVVSYAVARRVKEIGIRVALGAGSRDITALVLQTTLVLAGIGLGLGLMGAFAAGRVLRGMIPGVSPFDPATVVVALIMLGGASLAAAMIPARRATRVDPLEAMRAE